MNEKDLAALQPTDQTGAEIRAALARIADAKQSLQSRLTDTRDELAEKERTFSLSSAARRKLADVVADIEQDLHMLTSLAVQTEAPLANIELVERDALLGAERISILTEMEALDETWAVEYPILHAALKKLLAGRAELISRAEDHIFRALNIFKPINLTAFSLPSEEVRLLKTPAQRDFDAIPDWQHAVMAQAKIDAARNAARAARTPVVFDDTPPKPVLTVGGVAQAMPGRGW